MGGIIRGFFISALAAGGLLAFVIRLPLQVRLAQQREFKMRRPKWRQSIERSMTATADAIIIAGALITICAVHHPHGRWWGTVTIIGSSTTTGNGLFS